MGAVWMRARAEMRGKGPALLALALVIGLGGGLVLASAAGARRTDSVLDRFLASKSAADVELVDDNTGPAAAVSRAKIQTMSQVADTAAYYFIYLKIGAGVAAVSPADDKFGTSMDRFKIIRGRAPVAADEAAISLDVAQRYHMGIGSEIAFEDAIAYLGNLNATPAALEAAKSIRIHVVGIEIGPGDLPPPAPIGSVGVRLTKGFVELLKQVDTPHISLAVRLKDGGDVRGFLAALGPFGDNGHVFAVTNRDLQAGTTRSFHLQSNAFWLLAALIGLVSCMIFGQAIGRQASLESIDVPALRALGMSRAQLFGVGMARAGMLAVFAAFLAALVGYLLTPLSPIGLARTAEPHQGFLLDGIVLGLGAAAVLVTVVILALIPTWRAAGMATAEAEQQQRTSRFAGALTKSGSSASMVAGARLAFQRGRGRTAVPVRSSLAGSIIGVAALVAALCFGASLIHLVRTPELYGWRWDYFATSYGLNDFRSIGDAALRVPGIQDIAVGGSAAALTVDNVQLTAFMVVTHRGDPFPPIVEGRAPTAPNEIVVGSKALRDMHKHVGDRVSVVFGTHTAFVGGQPAPGAGKVHVMRVVGRGVFPSVIDQQLGYGALVQDDSFADLPVGDRTVDAVALRFVSGADRQAVITQLRSALAPAA
ncbi:MAG TPA: FtsX-like permease family protein, partial [Actinomycetota bacterium]|nr:FtsX-like permease family protein [Actinomycetota bacterium]